VYRLDDTVVEEKVNALASIITESEAYKKYRAASDKLKKDSDLFKKVMEMKRKNFYHQNEKKYDCDIKSEYRDVLKNETVISYLKYEMIVLRNINYITEKYTEKIELDIKL